MKRKHEGQEQFDFEVPVPAPESPPDEPVEISGPTVAEKVAAMDLETLKWMAGLCRNGQERCIAKANEEMAKGDALSIKLAGEWAGTAKTWKESAEMYQVRVNVLEGL